MSKVKIGILGACFSRDNFNSRIMPDYKNFYECVIHQNQMTMISLMSQPIPYLNEEIDGPLSPHDKRQLATELDKSFLQTIKLANPDYLIIDFYADVMMGVAKIGEGYISNKETHWSKTTFYKNKKINLRLTIHDNYQEYFALWKKAVKRFFEFMKKNLPECRIIIHEGKYSDQYIDNQLGGVHSVMDKIKQNQFDIDEYNKKLDLFNSYIKENYRVLNIDYNRQYLADECHIWGLYYLHFEPQFYIDFHKKLLTLILNDLNEPNYVTRPIGNLIKNGDFNQGQSFWSYWNDEFAIKNTGNENYVYVSRKNLSDDKIIKLWSNLVELGFSNGKFQLKFEIKVDDIEEVDSHQAIFTIRTFDKTNKFYQTDASWYKYIKLDDIKNLQSQKWIKYSVIIKPKGGNFMRLGPYIFRNGKVSWKNISLSSID